MRNSDDMLKLLMETATATNDTDKVLEIIQEGQKMTISMFSLYILMEGKEHEDCDPKGCNVIKLIPQTIERFKQQFLDDLDTHLAINLAINNIETGEPEETINQKTHREILEEMDIKPQAD